MRRTQVFTLCLCLIVLWMIPHACAIDAEAGEYFYSAEDVAALADKQQSCPDCLTLHILPPDNGNTPLDCADLLIFPHLACLYVDPAAPLENTERIGELQSLQVLHLPGQHLTSADFLSSLPLLTEVSLENNLLTDLSGLAGLPHLAVADFRRNAVSNISVVATWPELTELYLGGNRSLSDLSPLAECTGIVSLSVADTGVQDLSPLASLTALKSLQIQGNGLTDLSPLGHTSALQWLEAADNAITDVSPLQGHLSLWYIDLTGNPVENPETLGALPEIRLEDILW